MSTFFDGKGTRARVVRMSGASAHAESAAAVVERARRERAQRRELQARTAAATRIAAFYRGRSTARAVREQQRAACDAQLAACLAPATTVDAPRVAALAAALPVFATWARDLERLVKTAVVLAKCVRARTLFCAAAAVPHGGHARYHTLLARLAALLATVVADPAARSSPPGGLVLWAVRCLTDEHELATAAADNEDVSAVCTLARARVAAQPGFFPAMQAFLSTAALTADAAVPEAHLQSAAAVLCAAARASPAAARAFVADIGARVRFAAVPAVSVRRALAACLADCLAPADAAWAAALDAPAALAVVQNVLPVLAAAPADAAPALVDRVLDALAAAEQRLRAATETAAATPRLPERERTLVGDVLAQVGDPPVLGALARRATDLWLAGADETACGRALFVFLGTAFAAAPDRRAQAAVRHRLAADACVVPVLWQCWTERGRLAAAVRDPAAALPPALRRVLGVWAGCCLAALAPLDDDDLAAGTLFFPPPELARMVPLLLRLAWQWYTSSSSSSSSNIAGTATEKEEDGDAQMDAYDGDLGTVARLLSELHDRDTRLHFCAAPQWLLPCVMETAASATPRSAFVRALPFVVPLAERLAWFRTGLRAARTGAEHRVTVRRAHVAEDAYAQLAPLGPAALAGRVRVTFVDAATGAAEAGIDGGGLFRDMLTRVVRTVFAPEYGLFARTPAGTLAPSAHAPALLPDWAPRFRFAGALLGKCLLEDVLVDLPLARCFLRQVLACCIHSGTGGGGSGSGSGSGSGAALSDLAALDPVLARNLARLKTAFVDDLTFAVVEPAAPGTGAPPRVVELVPGGAARAVTPANRLAYIALVADWRVRRATRAPTAAFAAGLGALVRPARLLALLTADELQAVLGGAPGGIDVDDWEAHTAYTPPAARARPCVRWFWATLRALTPRQQADVLLFATGCARPPLLGFAHMAPPFALAVVAPDRWPTAATCMNLLRIPDEASPERLREKLLAATSVDNGFFLS